MGTQIIIKKADFSRSAIYKENLQVLSIISQDYESLMRSSNSTTCFTPIKRHYSALLGKSIVGIQQLVKKGNLQNSTMNYYNVEVKDCNLAEVDSTTFDVTKYKGKTIIFSRSIEEQQELFNSVQDGDIITTLFDEPVIYDGSHILAFNHNGIFAYYGAPGVSDYAGMAGITVINSSGKKIIPAASSIYSNTLAFNAIYDGNV